MIQNLEMIVGYDKNRAIGFQGDMPWKKDLPADLQHFRALTTGNTVIMGAVTYQTIGRPLPKRKNIVLSLNPDFLAEGVTVLNSIDQLKSEIIEGIGFVMGGAQIYKALLPSTVRIHATEVHGSFDADTYIVDFPTTEWVETQREAHRSDSANKYDYDFVVYERQAN